MPVLKTAPVFAHFQLWLSKLNALALIFGQSFSVPRLDVVFDGLEPGAAYVRLPRVRRFK